MLLTTRPSPLVAHWFWCGEPRRRVRERAADEGRRRRRHARSTAIGAGLFEYTDEAARASSEKGPHRGPTRRATAVARRAAASPGESNCRRRSRTSKRALVHEPPPLDTSWVVVLVCSSQLGHVGKEGIIVELRGARRRRVRDHKVGDELLRRTLARACRAALGPDARGARVRCST